MVGLLRHLAVTGLALATAVAGTAGCARPKPAPPVLTVDQQRMAATDYALECMSSAGVDCLASGEAGDGWSALGELAAVERAPLAVLSEQILAAAARLADGRVANQRLAGLAAPVEMLSRDLSCRGFAAREVGADFAARRQQLAALARWRGLVHTEAGTALANLVAAAAAIDHAYLVTARCTGGEVHALLTPPRRPLDADDDPRAHDAGGWEVFAVAISADLLLGGFVLPTPTPSPEVADQPPDFAVDPWLPLTEVEL